MQITQGVSITSKTRKLTPILTATVLMGVFFLLGPGFPINAEAVETTEFLTCRATADPGNAGFPLCDLQTGVANNDLFDTAPAGLVAVLEPDTVEHTAQWFTPASTDQLVLLPGSVTLSLVMMNHAENAGSNDICWSKHAVLPDGSEIIIVADHCFENPLPVTPGVCSFGAIPASAACIALAAVVEETVPSLILVPTVLPVGTQIELNISCPGSSFIGVFFNGGIDTDGDGILDFSKIIEQTSRPIGGDYFTLNATALVLSGVQTNLAWIIPVLSVAGIGLFVVSRKR